MRLIVMQKIRMTEVIEQLDKATSLVDSHYNNNGVVNKAIRELTDWLDKTHRETDLAIRKNISELETKLTYLESAK